MSTDQPQEQDQDQQPLEQQLATFRDDYEEIKKQICRVIVGQHEIIALQKLRQHDYDTFKFYYRDGNFFWANNPADYKEPLRLPGLRLSNSLTMLIDLGLVTRDEAGVCRLTVDGRHNLQRVLEAANGD